MCKCWYEGAFPVFNWNDSSYENYYDFFFNIREASKQATRFDESETRDLVSTLSNIELSPVDEWKEVKASWNSNKRSTTIVNSVGNEIPEKRADFERAKVRVRTIKYVDTLLIVEVNNEEWKSNIADRCGEFD